MGLHRTLLLLCLCVTASVSASPAERAATIAQKYVGAPYLWGGATPSGFDCSGLVQFVYAEAGVANLPRTVAHQQSVTTPVPRNELRKGDLLFFTLRDGRRPHVGIYIGSGQFVHARSRGKHVAHAQLDSPFWQKRFTGARRVLVEN